MSFPRQASIIMMIYDDFWKKSKIRKMSIQSGHNTVLRRLDWFFQIYPAVINDGLEEFLNEKSVQINTTTIDLFKKRVSDCLKDQYFLISLKSQALSI